MGKQDLTLISTSFRKGLYIEGMTPTYNRGLRTGPTCDYLYNMKAHCPQKNYNDASREFKAQSVPLKKLRNGLPCSLVIDADSAIAQGYQLLGFITLQSYDSDEAMQSILRDMGTHKNESYFIGAMLVRNAIRCNDHETLGWSWRYFAPLFRATNKHQYAAYGVQQAATVYMMRPSVRRVWDEHRTASMTGRPGRNAAWDYVLEKMNLSYKQFLCGTITEERLNDFGVMINALKHTRKQFKQAWRHGAGNPDDEDAPGEYSHVKDADVKVLVDALKAHLGGTKDDADKKAAAFADADRTNPFSGNQRLLLPWGGNQKGRNAPLARSLHPFLEPPSGDLLEDPRTPFPPQHCRSVMHSKSPSTMLLSNLLNSTSTTVVAVPSSTRTTIHSSTGPLNPKRPERRFAENPTAPSFTRHHGAWHQAGVRSRATPSHPPPWRQRSASR